MPVTDPQQTKDKEAKMKHSIHGKLKKLVSELSDIPSST